MVDHPVPVGIRYVIEVFVGPPGQLRHCSIAAGPDAPDMLKRILHVGTRRGLPVATDIETFGLGQLARRLKAVSIAVADEDDAYAVVLDPRDARQRRMIRWAYQTAHERGLELVLHNSTFDVPNLHLYRPDGEDGLFHRDWCASVVDNLIYARLAWPGDTVSRGLGALSERYLGLSDGAPIEALFKVNGWRNKVEGYYHADIDNPTYLLGNALDALTTAMLLPIVRDAALSTLTDNHPFSTWGVQGADARALRDREQVINRMTLRRACRGLRIDEDYYTAYLDAVTADQDRRAAELTAVGVRPSNTADLSRWADAAGLLGDDWPMNKTGPKMDKTHQATLAARDPSGIAATFRTHKQTAKDLTDYLGKVHELAVTDPHGDARIHPVTNLLAAVTGRTSMGNPPLQQFSGIDPKDPRKGSLLGSSGFVDEGARGIIIAERGERLVSIDWSQIEPVLFANIAGDLDALAGYESGERDFYTDLGTLAKIDRKGAKTALLAQLYGQGVSSLAERLHVDEETARTYVAAVWTALPASRRLAQRYRRIGEQHRQVFTLSGRILPIPMMRNRKTGEWGVGTHLAVNYPTQGGAYDVLAESLVRIDAAGLGDALYFTLHDETVVAEDAAHDVQQIMQTPPERLCQLAKRTPILRTDLQLMPERWEKC